MKKVKLLLIITLISISSGLYANPITVSHLSKKWKLEKYSYLLFSEDPEKKEQHDYILLKQDMSFESVSEGKYKKGKWRLNIKDKRIYMLNDGEKEELVFIIDELNDHELILMIDDPSDSDSKDLKIHFNSK